nr:uncharacterized protein LOC109159590 [Ipomoea batatas]
MRSRLRCSTNLSRLSPATSQAVASSHQLRPPYLWSPAGYIRNHILPSSALSIHEGSTTSDSIKDHNGLIGKVASTKRIRQPSTSSEHEKRLRRLEWQDTVEKQRKQKSKRNRIRQFERHASIATQNDKTGDFWAIPFPKPVQLLEKQGPPWMISRIPCPCGGPEIIMPLLKVLKLYNICETAVLLAPMIIVQLLSMHAVHLKMTGEFVLLTRCMSSENFRGLLSFCPVLSKKETVNPSDASTR